MVFSAFLSIIKMSLLIIGILCFWLGRSSHPLWSRLMREVKPNRPFTTLSISLGSTKKNRKGKNLSKRLFVLTNKTSVYMIHWYARYGLDIFSSWKNIHGAIYHWSVGVYILFCFRSFSVFWEAPSLSFTPFILLRQNSIGKRKKIFDIQ